MSFPSRRLSPLTRAVRATASALGFTVIPHWRLRNYPQAEFMSRLFGYLEIDCVLDVGANRGQYRDFLRDHVGYDGLIVSFEPLPTLTEHLRKRSADDPQWIVYACALGREGGTACFNIMANDVFSSFLSPSTTKTSLFEQMNQVHSQVEVEVRTLDDVVEEVRATTSFHRPYLKMDTQGFDLSVVDGAQYFLPQLLALQTEASVTSIYEDSPDFATVIRELERRGFALSGIFPNNPEHFPRMFEFDCHMVNRALLPSGR